MDMQSPIQPVDHFSWAALIVFGVVGIGILFLLTTILSTFTGRPHRVRTSEQNPAAHRYRGPAIPGVLAFVAFVFIGLVLVWGLTVTDQRVATVADPSSTHQIAQVATPQPPAPPLPVAAPEAVRSHSQSEESSAHGASGFMPKPGDPFASDSGVASSSDVDLENKNTEPATRLLPEWTHRKQTVLAEGQVPKVLFVETSGLYSSEQEAMSEAMTTAVSKFQTRLAETYHELADQPVPEDIFREASLQQVYTEKRIHTFGVYDEPMYRVYLQYMDSAEAREPVVDAWKSTFASNRAMQYGVIFGILTAGLGVVSAGLRAVSASKGNRSRSVMTALALAGVGAATLLVLA